MKKLNRQGFTLIELLAIIVILAIIMVVTIPTILNATETATEKQLKNAADSIEKWVSDQYTLTVVGTRSDTFTNVCGYTGSDCTGTTAKEVGPTSDAGKAFLSAAGVLAADYSSVTVKIDSATNRVCVTVKASEKGSFSGLYNKETGTKTSNGC